MQLRGRLIKKYGKENNAHLYEQMMVKKGDMLKSDVNLSFYLTDLL